MIDLGSDDRETSRVIAISDGARHVGWLEGLQDVSNIIAALARNQAARGLSHAQPGYPDALNDILERMQALMAERRKT